MMACDFSPVAMFQINVVISTEHEHCCQSKWCWPVGCKQKLGGLSLNHLRPEVE